MRSATGTASFSSKDLTMMLVFGGSEMGDEAVDDLLSLIVVSTRLEGPEVDAASVVGFNNSPPMDWLSLPFTCD